MARRCKVCTSTHKIQIDQQLKNGESTAKLARQYSLSEDSLTRHRQHHVQITSAVTSSTSELLRDLIVQYEALADECRLKADLYGARVCMNQKLQALTQLAAIEDKNPELRKRSGIEKMSIELIDSIIKSVELSHEECPTCHQPTIPKVVAPIPRRPVN